MGEMRVGEKMGEEIIESEEESEIIIIFYYLCGIVNRLLKSQGCTVKTILCSKSLGKECAEQVRQSDEIC
jgi:hypothetical protein